MIVDPFDFYRIVIVQLLFQNERELYEWIFKINPIHESFKFVYKIFNLSIKKVVTKK